MFAIYLDLGYITRRQVASAILVKTNEFKMNM